MSLAAVTGLAAQSQSSGIFDVINGVPVHPLVVHAVVIFVPVAATGLLVMVASPKFSRRFGIVVVLASIAGAGAAFVAKEAGQALQERVGEPGFNHAELGSAMPWFALALMAAVIGLWLLDRRADPDEPWTRDRLRIGVSVIAVVVALASLVWIVRVGDSGGKSVWSGVVSSPADVTDGGTHS